MTKRTCGTCSMCCKIMAVPNFPAKPDQHDWCQHANEGCGGCAIYPRRPEECRDFHCMWLIDQRIPDYWFPAKSKIVINPKLAGAIPIVAFVVDPIYPGRWREEPYFSDIKRLAKAGIKGLHGSRIGQKWTTVILIGDERIPIVA